MTLICRVVYRRLIDRLELQMMVIAAILEKIIVSTKKLVKRRCHRKVDHFTQTAESYYVTVVFPGFFGIDLSGSIDSQQSCCLIFGGTCLVWTSDRMLLW